LRNITILTEAGKTIGFGHYTRCSSLYQALTKAGNPVRFVVYENEYAINDPNTQSLNWLKSFDSLSPIKTNDIAIIDSYLADENIYKQLAKYFNKVIAIDDYNRINYPVDVIINPNVFFEDIDYSNQTAVCIGGKDFVILRPEFTDVEASDINSEKLQNILITIGGSDYRNLLPKLISICEQQKGVNITVIDPENKLSNQQHVRVLPAQTAAQMVHEMQQADIVISACGQTLHELTTLGRPTIGICLDIDQVPNQKYYLEQGVLLSKINWDDKDLMEKVTSSLINFFPYAIRKEVGDKALSLSDKNGVNNITALIQEHND
jgi:UDP-2,4-diacetamido-2,4,6-trideoxy-beta-L-altropyranose hydrolase